MTLVAGISNLYAPVADETLTQLIRILCTLFALFCGWLPPYEVTGEPGAGEWAAVLGCDVLRSLVEKTFWTDLRQMRNLSAFGSVFRERRTGHQSVKCPRSEDFALRVENHLPHVLTPNSKSATSQACNNFVSPFPSTFTLR